MAKVINVVYKIDSKEWGVVKKQIEGTEKETKKAELQMNKLGDAAKFAGQKGGQSFLSFKNILASITVVGIIAGLTQLGRKIFDLGVKQEQLNISFTTFLGSAAKAKILLADLTKFAIVTPFTPDQVNNAAKALLAFGVKGKEIIPTLKMLGDVSSGTGKDLTEMAIIFGQIRSTGRLMGQDLLQLINAGFNPLQIISEKTGKSVADLKEEMEKGLISFEMVSDAFKTATSEGGLFFNLMEKQSKSIGGITSTISGNFDEMGKQIFEVFQGGTKSVVEFFAEWTSGLISLTEEEQKAFKLSSELFLFQQRALLATNQTLEERRQTMRLIVEAEKALGKFQPGTTEDPLPWADEKKGEQTIGIIEGINKKLDALKTARDKALSVQEIKSIIAEITELEKQLKKLTGTTEVDTKALKEREKALKLLMGVGRRLGKDIKEGGEEADERESQRRSDAIDREIEQNKRRADLLIQNEQDMEDERIRIAEEAAERRNKIQEEIQNFAIDSLQQVLYASFLTNEEDFSAQREKFDQELELAGDNERAKDQIRRREEEAEKAFRQRQKEAEKQNALKKIAIDTAINVIRSIANNGGIPLGLPFGGLAFAAGLLQAAIVRKLAKGEVGINGPGTKTSDSIPAMLSVGESVINADATRKSSRLLEAINDRKIDDGILYKIASNGGRQATAFDDSRIVDAINKNRIDYDTHGYTIMKGIQKGKNFKHFIRSKVQGY